MKSINRIHVLLRYTITSSCQQNFLILVSHSRAKHGLCIIGNAETACSKVPTWGKVCDVLQSKEAIGRHLRLCCPRHQTAVIEIREPEDFLSFAPEGGCKEACDK